jgi:hypothetical protein
LNEKSLNPIVVEVHRYQKVAFMVIESVTNARLLIHYFVLFRTFDETWRTTASTTFETHMALFSSNVSVL